MAMAGCVTITNAYEGKNLSRRSENIISMHALTPACLAEALEKAVARVAFDREKVPRSIKPLESLAPPADFGRIAEFMLETSGEFDKVIPMRPAKAEKVRSQHGKRG
jgi:hypothetical protein